MCAGLYGQSVYVPERITFKLYIYIEQSKNIISVKYLIIKDIARFEIMFGIKAKTRLILTRIALPFLLIEN